MSELKLKIVTPDKVFFDDKIDMLIARSSAGDFAILKNHHPMIASLDIRALKIKINDKFLLAAVAGGYLTFKDNEIVIMSDACEWSEDIDENRAIVAKERAERRLKEAVDKRQIDIAELELKRAINRLNIKQNKM
ncbi:ATP synthase F1 subunit epsilon [Helcococcus kunzii]|uniref:ATP synthase F1 subunit epsilon n=1 Tax=Helcococcus kunzii TaxID=40091 RepID=UPI00389C45DF